MFETIKVCNPPASTRVAILPLIATILSKLVGYPGSGKEFREVATVTHVV